LRRPIEHPDFAVAGFANEARSGKVRCHQRAVRRASVAEHVPDFVPQERIVLDEIGGVAGFIEPDQDDLVLPRDSGRAIRQVRLEVAVDLHGAKRSRKDEAEQRERRNVRAHPIAHFHARGKHEGRRAEDRERAQRRVQVADSPPMPLREAYGEIAEEHAGERGPEERKVRVSPACPPASRREDQEAGNGPIPQAGQLRQAGRDHGILRPRKGASHLDVPAPEEIDDLVERVVVERQNPGEGVSLNTAQEQRPAQAQNQDEGNIPGDEREQLAVAIGMPGDPHDPWQREQRVRKGIVEDQSEGSDQSRENEADRSQLQQQPREDQVEEQVRGH